METFSAISSFAVNVWIMTQSWIMDLIALACRDCRMMIRKEISCVQTMDSRSFAVWPDGRVALAQG
jgi:hypothetical protein